MSQVETRILRQSNGRDTVEAWVTFDDVTGAISGFHGISHRQGRARCAIGVGGQKIEMDTRRGQRTDADAQGRGLFMANDGDGVWYCPHNVSIARIPEDEGDRGP